MTIPINNQSTNEFCGSLPPQRFTYQARGKLLYFPRTKMVMVPFDMRDGYWDCVVVYGASMYTVGRYHLCVSDIEIITAIEIDIDNLIKQCSEKYQTIPEEL